MQAINFIDLYVFSDPLLTYTVNNMFQIYTDSLICYKRISVVLGTVSIVLQYSLFIR